MSATIARFLIEAGRPALAPTPPAPLTALQHHNLRTHYVGLLTKVEGVIPDDDLVAFMNALRDGVHSDRILAMAILIARELPSVDRDALHEVLALMAAGRVIEKARAS